MGLLSNITLIPIVFLGYGLLILIEEWGVRFFGRQRNWRVTSDIAKTVCAHASVGWIICSALLSSLWVVLEVYARNQRVATSRNLPADYVGILFAATFVFGMLVFETLVYIGVRRCKFANRSRPPSPTDSAPA